MASRPSTYINWVPSGSSSYIQQPSSGQSTSGWVAGEAPPFQYMNWLFYYLDQWTQYLDSSLTTNAKAVLLSADSTIYTTTGDVASGSANVSNVPITKTTTANTVNGSDTITGLASTTNIVAGQSISGTGIPSKTKVISISGTSVVMSQLATATGTAVSVTFSRLIPKGTSITGTNIPANTYVVSTSGTTVVMSANATGTATTEAITFAHNYALGDNVQFQLDQLDGQMYFNTFAPQIVTASSVLTTTGNIATGSNSIASLGSTTGLIIGMAVSGSGVPSTAFIVSISGSTIVISEDATATTTGVTLTFAHRYGAATDLKTQLDQLDAAVSQATTGVVPFWTKTSNGNATVSGINVLQANFTVASADTYTLNSGAGFFVLGGLTLSGTLVANDSTVIQVN